jgi:hypothetical protein
MQISKRLSLFFLLIVHCTDVTAIPPIKPPRVDLPEVPSIPKPGGRPNYNPAEPHIGDDMSPAQQTVVASNMQLLEQRLEAVQNGLDIGTALVDAILSTQTSSLNWADLATMTAKPTETVSVSKTLDMSLFSACKSYANTLSSCASATSDFFTLDAIQQASCACYTLSALSIEGCASVPMLKTASHDAGLCQSFFNQNGFSEIASVMSDAGRVEGVGFCGGLSRQQAQNATMTGLAETLEPTACTISRLATPSATVTEATGGAVRIRNDFGEGGQLVS